jgi:hypothetical protein
VSGRVRTRKLLLIVNGAHIEAAAAAYAATAAWVHAARSPEGGCVLGVQHATLAAHVVQWMLSLYLRHLHTQPAQGACSPLRFEIAFVFTSTQTSMRCTRTQLSTSLIRGVE